MPTSGTRCTTRAGRCAAAEYRFPYADGTFDLVLATSVFTHLLADTAARYLAEAARVLAPGGVLFATWFLLRPDPALSDGAAFRFAPFDGGPAFVADPALPEAAVGYEASWVEDRLAAGGLALDAAAAARYVGRDAGNELPGRRDRPARLDPDRCKVSAGQRRYSCVDGSAARPPSMQGWFRIPERILFTAPAGARRTCSGQRSPEGDEQEAERGDRRPSGRSGAGSRSRSGCRRRMRARR